MKASDIAFVACFRASSPSDFWVWRNVRLRAERKRRSWESPIWNLTFDLWDRQTYWMCSLVCSLGTLDWIPGALHCYTPPREWRNCCLFPGRTTICHSRAREYLERIKWRGKNRHWFVNKLPLELIFRSLLIGWVWSLRFAAPPGALWTEMFWRLLPLELTLHKTVCFPCLSTIKILPIVCNWNRSLVWKSPWRHSIFRLKNNFLNFVYATRYLVLN